MMDLSPNSDMIINVTLSNGIVLLVATVINCQNGLISYLVYQLTYRLDIQIIENY
jgi:biotin transporter BioY